MDEQVNAVRILSSLNTVPTVQETVKKEMRKINFFVSQVQQFISERDFTKLQRLCETTLPGKLAVMEDSIERMVEVMIDEKESDEEIKKWSAQTSAVQGCSKVTRAWKTTFDKVPSRAGRYYSD